MGTPRLRLVLVLGAVMALSALALLPRPAPGAESCPNLDRARVPGAERQQRACLADLTTAGLVASGHTVQADWRGVHAAATQNPTGVPGIQVDGYFPDTSNFNTRHGWNHDAQFVLRLPNRWNGKLVVTGAPGNSSQYAHDFLASDWVLARGYAYASTDKGNLGVTFYRDGATPGDALLEWHRRLAELTTAAKATLALRYGRPPQRTYVTGMSNGGYLARYALEHSPGLYDGGVDWEGTLFRAEPPNPLTYLPVALREYPGYAESGSRAAHDAMIAAGFAPGSEFLWPVYHQVWWDATQRIYREEFDPGYDGATEAGTPYCRSGTPGCDADYDYANRPPEVKAAMAKVSVTGRIGKPLVTLHGTLDTLLPIATDSDVYARMVAAAGRSGGHRYYRIEGGDHFDAYADLFPGRVRPILPCYRQAFQALEAWVEQGQPPPESHTVPWAPIADVANTCSL